MSIVAEFSIPPEAVPGGKTLREMPDASIQLERIIPTNERALPFFWVFNADPRTFLGHLQTEADIDDVTILTEVAHTALFKAEWAPEAEIIRGIKKLHATILEATGTAEEWLFQVRAQEREHLTAFQRIFTSQGIPVEVRRIYNFAEMVAGEHPLTPEQRETLIAAYQHGYFDQPRRVTQEDLGDLYSITGRAISNRLRRGTKNLIASTLLDPTDRGAPPNPN